MATTLQPSHCAAAPRLRALQRLGAAAAPLARWQPPIARGGLRAAAAGNLGPQAGSTGRRLVSRAPSATPSGDQPLAGDSPAASLERQGERVLAYTALAALLGSLGLLQVALPQYCVELAFRATPTAVVQGMLRLAGGTWLLAAVAAQCLKEAAEHDRLKSDTYQRLNLGIMWWALGSLAAVWLAPVRAQPLVQGAYTVLMAFAALTTATTFHATSPEGLNPPYLLARLVESAGSTWDTSNFNTAAYGLGALLTGFGALAILVGKLPVLQAPKLAAPLGTLGGLFLKLTGVGMLLACIVYYTQKDAAARGRLGASTFKALNAGLALVCLNNLVVLTSWLRDGLVQLHGLRSPVVTASAALLAVCLWNYFTAKKK